MNDEEVTRLLDRLADRVPVDPPPVEHLVRGGRRLRVRRYGTILAVTAGAAVLFGGGIIALEVPGGGSRSADYTAREPLSTPLTPSPENPTSQMVGPLPDSGAASCTEEYAPEAVANRAFAFDGVIVEIGPSRSDRPDRGAVDLVGVTFSVQQWFAGGTGATVTVDMPPPLEEGQGGTAEVVPSYAVGSRLLVSGEPRWGGSPLDNAVAWGCGFTRYYDQQTAESWG